MIRRIFLFISLTVVAMATQSVAAQGLIDSVPLTEYDVSQYIMSSGSSPSSIINMDNNELVLRRCMTGCTLERLRSQEISVTHSQLKLLETWRLIEKDDSGTFKTGIPLLSGTDLQDIRMASSEAVNNSLDQLQPALMRFLSALESIDRKDAAYTLLFSYVLDDLVWRLWNREGLLPERKIDLESPFWAGEVWAVYPPREFSMGTNSMIESGIAFKVNWTHDAIPLMMPFVSDWKNFGAMIEDYIMQGRIVDPEAISVFKPFNLFDEQGTMTVPIIREEEGSFLFEQSMSLARKAAASFMAGMDLEGMTEELGLRDLKQTIVVVYHEWMWDLMDVLEAQGLVRKPLVFSDPSSSSSQDVGDLVFIVHRENSTLDSR